MYACFRVYLAICDTDLYPLQLTGTQHKMSWDQRRTPARLSLPCALPLYILHCRWAASNATLSARCCYDFFAPLAILCFLPDSLGFLEDYYIYGSFFESSPAPSSFLDLDQEASIPCARFVFLLLYPSFTYILLMDRALVSPHFLYISPCFALILLCFTRPLHCWDYLLASCITFHSWYIYIDIGTALQPQYKIGTLAYVELHI